MMREPKHPAHPPGAEARRRIEEEELLGLLLEKRPGDEGKGAMFAHVPTVLRRLRFPLECLGGILFGVNIAVITLILNFILFNLLLHLEF